MPRQPKTTHLIIDMPVPTEWFGGRARGWIPSELSPPGPKSAPGKEGLKRRMAELGDRYPGGLPHRYWIAEFGASSRQYYRAYREHRQAR
jgi:hypothetical protein